MGVVYPENPRQRNMKIAADGTYEVGAQTLPPIVYGNGSISVNAPSQTTVWSQPYNAPELASKANQGGTLTDEEKEYLRSRGYSEIAGERTVYTKKHYAGGLFDSRGNYTGNGRYTYYDSLDGGSNVVSSRQEAFVYWERADNPDSISLTQKLESFENKIRVGGINTFGSAYNKLAVYPHRLKDWGNEGLQSQAEDIEYTWLSEESAKAPGWINPRIGQVADWYQNTVLDNMDSIGLNFLKGVPLLQVAYNVPDALAGTQRLISYGSTLIPGVETIAKKPETLAYSVALVPDSLYQTWEYGLDNPKEFAVDMALGAVVGAGVSKGLKIGTGAVSERLPAISTKATPQDVLLKVELPKTPKTIASEGIKYTEAEYVGQGMGKDIFNLSEKMQGDLATIPERGPTIDVLVGKETKAGTQEVFFKLTDEQARTVGDNYFVKSRDINIGGKSYLELTAIEKIERPNFIQHDLIGERLLLNERNRPAIRLETKVKAVEGEIELKPLEPRLQLPESTQEINIKSGSMHESGNGVSTTTPTDITLEQNAIKQADIAQKKWLSDETEYFRTGTSPGTDRVAINTARNKAMFELQDLQASKIGELSGQDLVTQFEADRANWLQEEGLTGPIMPSFEPIGSVKPTKLSESAQWEADEAFYMRTGTSPGTDRVAINTARNKAMFELQDLQASKIGELSGQDLVTQFEADRANWLQEEGLTGPIMPSFEPIGSVKPTKLSESAQWEADEAFYMRTGTSPGTDRVAINTARNKAMFELQDLQASKIGELSGQDLVTQFEADRANWLQEEGLTGPIMPKFEPIGSAKPTKLSEADITEQEFSTAIKFSPTDFEIADGKAGWKGGNAQKLDEISTEGGLVLLKKPLETKTLSIATETELIAQFEASNAKWLVEENVFSKMESKKQRADVLSSLEGGLGKSQASVLEIPQVPKITTDFGSFKVVPTVFQPLETIPTKSSKTPVNIPVQLPQMPVNTPSQVPVNIPVQIPFMPVTTPTKVPQVPVNVPVQIPQIPVNTPSQVPVNIPVQIPFMPVTTPTRVPVNIPVQIPRIPVTTPGQTTSIFETGAAMQSMRMLHIFSPVPGFGSMQSDPLLSEDKRRQSQPILSPDLRTAVNGMKLNKFYNPLDALNGINNQLSKQFRRGL